MGGILDGKRILVTGVLTDASIAFHVAACAQRQGAAVVLTGYGRMSLVERVARRLPEPAPVVELDVTDPDQLAELPAKVRAAAGPGRLDGPARLDGVVHAIGFAPPQALGGNFLTAGWPDVATALHVSTYSLQALAVATLPLFAEHGGSIVGLDFDASVAWPGYDWMGVAKAGLESCARYLASYLGPRGIRVNLVAAGPLRTKAATSLSTFEESRRTWAERAPLGWAVDDPTATAMACAVLLSDWLPATTGEILHVDGGAHAVAG